MTYNDHLTPVLIVALAILMLFVWLGVKQDGSR